MCGPPALGKQFQAVLEQTEELSDLSSEPAGRIEAALGQASREVGYGDAVSPGAITFLPQVLIMQHDSCFRQRSQSELHCPGQMSGERNFSEELVTLQLWDAGWEMGETKSPFHLERVPHRPGTT